MSSFKVTSISVDPAQILEIPSSTINQTSWLNLYGNTSVACLNFLQENPHINSKSFRKSTNTKFDVWNPVLGNFNALKLVETSDKCQESQVTSAILFGLLLLVFFTKQVGQHQFLRWEREETEINRFAHHN